MAGRCDLFHRTEHPLQNRATGAHRVLTNLLFFFANDQLEPFERLAGGVVLEAGIFLFDPTPSGEAESGGRVGFRPSTAWARL